MSETLHFDMVSKMQLLVSVTTMYLTYREMKMLSQKLPRLKGLHLVFLGPDHLVTPNLTPRYPVTTSLSSFCHLRTLRIDIERSKKAADYVLHYNQTNNITWPDVWKVAETIEACLKQYCISPR